MPITTRSRPATTDRTKTIGRTSLVASPILLLLVGTLPLTFNSSTCAQMANPRITAARQSALTWTRLPDLPDPLGVAGPFIGVHKGVLVVAGGANFPRPIWESQKLWRRKIHVLIRQGTQYKWIDGGALPIPIAYGAAISTDKGIICLGGNRDATTFDRVFALHWDPASKRVTQLDYPPLPRPCAYGQATLIGDILYLAGGQHGAGLASAMANLWALDLAGDVPPASRTWRILPPCPGGQRAFNLTVSQNNGADDCLYVISGRRQGQDGVQFLRDTWEYNVRFRKWRRRADAPRCVMAGTAIAAANRNVVILGGADGTLFDKADVLKDRHPGFPRQAWQFDTAANSWSSAGATPQNHVTTHAVRFGAHVVVASGEIRPRVRSPWVWQIQLPGVAAKADPQDSSGRPISHGVPRYVSTAR